MNFKAGLTHCPHTSLLPLFKSRLLLYTPFTLNDGWADHSAAPASPLKLPDTNINTPHKPANARNRSWVSTDERLRPAYNRPIPSRHHHHVATLQQYVLLQVSLLEHIAVSEMEDLLIASATPHNLDLVLGRIGREAPCHTQRLQHIRIVADQILSWFVHTSQDVDAVTQNFEHRDRHMWIREILAQPLRNFTTDIFCCTTCRGHVPDEGKCNHPVWAHHRFLRKLFIFPDRHL